MNFQNFLHKINTWWKKHHIILQIIFSLSLSLFLILGTVKLTLIFKPLYYFDIQYLNIEQASSFSKEKIIKNYDYVISYLLSPKLMEFHLPSIPYSKYGEIHFEDVKKLFTSIDILLIITGLVNFIGLTINIRHKNFYFLKLTSYMLSLLPLILLTAFMINFNKSFVIFHKLFFTNDYWELDPSLDPIINILPQEFFYHSALLIILIIVVTIITLRLLYKRLQPKKQGY